MPVIQTTEPRVPRISDNRVMDALSCDAPILTIEDLHKSFGRFHALGGVTFSLRLGERLAFLGPNGAGKTTLIRCLSGRTRFDSGKIHLNGHAIDDPGVRDSIGIVPQEIALYGDLTARENLMTFGRLHGLARKKLKQQVDWALQWTGLEDRADELVSGFSGGMKRRVNLACGVLHSPIVLLLDEPTVGVDPQSREKIFMMLDDLNRRGTSIVLTTHHLDEAEECCDRIVIVDQGQVVANGTIDELIDRSIGRSRLVRLRLDRPPESHVSQTFGGQQSHFGPSDSNQLEMRLDDVSSALPALIQQISNDGYEVLDLEVQAPSLHHVFLHLTGKELRD